MSGVRAPYEELLFAFPACVIIFRRVNNVFFTFLSDVFFLPSRFWKYCSEKEEREASNSEGWHTFLLTEFTLDDVDSRHVRAKGLVPPGGKKQIDTYS